MLKKKKKKVETIEEIVASGTESQRFVLVGTYKKKPDQLAWIRKRHVYNYPLSAEEAKPGNEGWCKVKELWLYSGAKDRRHIYESELIGIKPRKEFLADYPDYPTGGSHSRATAHGDFYALFSVKHKYQPTIEDSKVVVRAKDFAKRTPKIAQAVKAYQAGGELGSLRNYLPAELAPLSHDQLRVCEATVHYCFMQWTPVVGVSPLLDKIESIVMSIGEFGRAHALSSSESYAYLKEYKGLEYLDKYHEPLSCFPIESLVDDLAQVCRNNGGHLR